MAGSVNGVDLIQSYPSDGTFAAGYTDWQVVVFNSPSADRTFRAYVECVRGRIVNANFNAGDPAV